MALFQVPGLTGGWKSGNTRLYIYILLLAVTVMIFYHLHQVQYAEAAAPEPDRQSYRQADPIEGRPDPIASIEPLPRFLATIVDADLGSNEEMSTRTANDLTRNDEAVRLSLSYLKGLSPKELNEAVRANSHYTWARLMQNPDKWRGRPLHFYGVVLQIDEVELPDLPEGLRKMFRLTLHDARLNNFYTVLTPQIATGLMPNTRVGLEGVFLKRYPYWCQPDPKKSGFWQWTPLLISTRAYVTWEPMPLPDLLSDPETKPFTLTTTLSELDIPFVENEILNVSKSGEGFRSYGEISIRHEQEARRIVDEKTGFEHLFKVVHHGEDLTPALTPAADRRLHFESLMTGDTAPEWAKWKRTEVEGWVRFVERVHVKGLESGIEQIYIVTITDGIFGNHQYNWSVAVLNLPHPLREGDYVTTRGIFTKLYPYKSKTNEWHWTPLVVSAGLTKVERKKEESGPLQYILATVVLAVIILGIYLNTRRDDRLRTERRQKIVLRRSARDAIRAVKRITREREAAAEKEIPVSSPEASTPATEEGGARESM